MSEQQIGGYAFMGVGGFLLLLALFFSFRTRRFLREATTVQGTVTGLAESSGSEGGTVYRPVVEFTTIEGEQITFQDNLGSNPPSHQPGDIVDVRYLPANPRKARLSGTFRLWFVPGLLSILGLVFLGTGPLWFLGDGADDAGPTPRDPIGISAGVASPGGIPVEGPVLSVQTGAGSALVQGACQEIESRRKGRVREVRLELPDQGSLVFTVRPYAGAGAYIPGQNVKVGGSFFEGAEGEISGAVIVENSETAGVVNLVRGDRAVSGPWDCGDV